MSEFFKKMFFLITFCDKRVLLGSDVFINDGNVNKDGSVVGRESSIRVDVMTVEFRQHWTKKDKI